MYTLDPVIDYSQEFSATTKAALRCLASHCGQGIECFPSMERIARYMSRSVRTAQRAIKELLELRLVDRKLHHTKTPTYRLLCMIERINRAERRRREKQEQEKQAQQLSTDSINRGDTGVVGLSSYRTDQIDNAINRNGVRTLQPSATTQTESLTPNNGDKDFLKPKRNHPAMVRVIAEDLAEVLGYQSFKYYLWLAWRIGEETLYECLAWVRQEYQEGKTETPGRLFTWRLRTFYNLRI